VMSSFAGTSPFISPSTDDSGTDVPGAGFFNFGFQDSSLGIVGTEPSDGSVLSVAPHELTVVFDRPLDPSSLGSGDIVLEKVDENGQVLFSLDPSTDPIVETLDDTGTRLTVELPSSLSLDQGTYQVVISEWSFLMGLDGSLLPEFGTAETVGTFT